MNADECGSICIHPCAEQRRYRKARRANGERKGADARPTRGHQVFEQQEVRIEVSFQNEISVNSGETGLEPVKHPSRQGQKQVYLRRFSWRAISAVHSRSITSNLAAQRFVSLNVRPHATGDQLPRGGSAIETKTLDVVGQSE
jgi:hypothetical protein